MKRTHNPSFCECPDPDPCHCGALRLRVLHLREDGLRGRPGGRLRRSTEHTGPYHYGDDGYAVDRPAVPVGTWALGAHP